MTSPFAPPADLAPTCESAFGEHLPQAVAYAELLAHEGTEWGLIGPRETDRLWDRHLLNSLCVAALIPTRARVADIGSGAGFPGLPLAIVRPDLAIDLVEPMQRRVRFLELCVARLGLESVHVVRARAEEYHPRPGVDIVTCRAVSAVAALLDMLSHLIPPATLLAIKGERAAAEIDSAHDQLHRHGLTATITEQTTAAYRLGTVVAIQPRARKAAPTPSRRPPRGAQPAT
ncbi:MAG: 16S rRNA (guanine(527)-N(7))-methyltransferase RsmG [Propionibacteriaceae bacterium]|jgi:16S rRNA (guanine527-N7)-methyltransferase|nr:16S rRNA (guanine(527)-N(7))-methyltransferase RsmG [Propionibacteriaceae bacterium]